MQAAARGRNQAPSGICAERRVDAPSYYLRSKGDAEHLIRESS